MRCLRNIVHILRGCVAAKEAGTEEWKAASTAMVVAVGAVAAKWEGVERVEGRTEADSREVARSEAAAMAAARMAEAVAMAREVVKGAAALVMEEETVVVEIVVVAMEVDQRT